MGNRNALSYRRRSQTFTFAQSFINKFAIEMVRPLKPTRNLREYFFLCASLHLEQYVFRGQIL